MKNIIATVFAVASLAASPLPGFAASSADVCSGPNVPEAWLRPGGYCDQAHSPGTLAPGNGGGGGFTCDPVTIASNDTDDDRLLLAVPVLSPCCAQLGSYEYDEELGHLILASTPCDNCNYTSYLPDQAWDRPILIGC